MPLSAYPKNYKLGPDNQSWLMRLKFKYFQVPLTGGPRVPRGFWKWRTYPKKLFLIFGTGRLRLESSNGDLIISCSDYANWARTSPPTRVYLSRIQPWCRWHFALLWPLGLTWHIFWNKKDIAKYPKYRSNFGLKKLFAGYLGWIRDGDKIYKPSLFCGGNFE
jgi:hypothetical protein